MEAGEPEESAAEEKEVEENDGERKAERIGSLANTSNGEDELAVVAVVVAVTVDVADVAFTGDEIVGFFKLARRWKGEETAAGEAIYFFFFGFYCCVLGECQLSWFSIYVWRVSLFFSACG